MKLWIMIAPREMCGEKLNQTVHGFQINFPGAISFWKKKGLEKYISSGLMKWRTSVVNKTVIVQITDSRPFDTLYEDDYQIIVKPNSVNNLQKLRLEEFLNEKRV